MEENIWDTKKFATLVLVGISVFILISITMFFHYIGGFLSEEQEYGEYYYTANIHGSSMYPYMQEGDIAIIQDCNYPEFNVDIGDIVVYYSNTEGDYIAHRVVLITHIDGNTRYYTKGDNNPSIDIGYATTDNVLGKVVRVADNWFEKWCYNVIMQE